MKNFFLKSLYKKIINFIFHPFLSVNIKPLEFELKEADKCLVIAPHPDDESIGCGGIMALYPDNFKVVCLTHSDDERRQEFENAMNHLKVEHEILNFKDKHISENYDKFSKIDFKGFNYIFIPYIYDQHNDHKAVSVLLNDYLKNNKIQKDLKIAFYEVWSAMNMPNYFVDISVSEILEKKKEAINCHKSQINDKDYTTKILGLNQYRGMIKNTLACECFTVLSKEDFMNIMKEI